MKDRTILLTIPDAAGCLLMEQLILVHTEYNTKFDDFIGMLRAIDPDVNIVIKRKRVGTSIYYRIIVWRIKGHFRSGVNTIINRYFMYVLKHYMTKDV
jgi:hypothetical protein